MARPETVGRTSVAPCGKNYLGNKHDNRQSADLNLYANLEQAAVGYPGD